MTSRIAPLGLLATLASCSGQLEGPPVSAAQLCERWASVTCSTGRACCERPGAISIEQCTIERRLACEREVLPLVSDPRTAYVPSRAGGFLARVQSARQDCSDTAAALLDPYGSPDFPQLFDGTGAPGADCTPATSGPADLLLARLSCGRTGRCRIGLRSDGSTRGTCEALPQKEPSVDDLACSHPYDCAEGEFCNLPGEWHPGVWGDCQVRRVAGWPCRGALECGSGLCASGSESEPATRCVVGDATRRYCPLSGGDALLPDLGVSDGGGVSDAAVGD